MTRATLAAGRRARRLGWVGLLTLVTLGACREPARPTAVDLTIMSFNIRWEIPGQDGKNGWPHRKEMVYGLLRDPDLDVAGLQEATPQQVADIQASVPTLVVHDADPVMNGIAILYRVDRFDLADSGAFWFSPTPDVPDSRDWSSPTRRHVCAWVRLVDRASGLAFYVYDVHLDLAEPSRRLSAVLLADRIAARPTPDPVFVVGDFNASEPEAASRYLRGELALGPTEPPRRTPVPLVDSFRILHPDATECGTAGGFRGATDRRKIDFVYVEPGTPVLAAQIDHFHVDGAYPSDHFPVRATVRLSR